MKKIYKIFSMEACNKGEDKKEEQEPSNVRILSDEQRITVVVEQQNFTNNPFDIFSRPSSYAQGLDNFYQLEEPVFVTDRVREGNVSLEDSPPPRSPSCILDIIRTHPSEVDLVLLDWDENPEVKSDNETDPLRIDAVINWNFFVGDVVAS